jgi:hypothetical protein
MQGEESPRDEETVKRRTKKWWVWIKRVDGKWFKASFSCRWRIGILYGEELVRHAKFEAYKVLPEGQRPKTRRRKP